MDRLGIAHTVLATVALLLGAAVVLRRKGDRVHRTIGHLYVASMLGVVVTALHIYDLFGTFGPFHVAALVSLVTIIAGMVPVVTRRPRRSWFRLHAYFMAWSYVGLVAAAVSEAAVRLPAVPFAPAVLAATLAAVLAGALLIHGWNGRLLREAMRKAGVTASVVTVVLITPALLTAQSSVDSTLHSHSIALETAVSRRDTAALSAVRREIAEMASADPGNGLVQHYHGYAWYRFATVGATGRARDAALDSAEEVLSRSASLLPLAETHALLATVAGLEIGGSAWRGALHGHRIASEMRRALELNPGSPRVALLEGVNAFYTPSAFGGGADRARRALERATALFGSDSPPTPLPHWGHAEAWAWLGRVRARQGDLSGAREAYEHALRLDPDYAWVTKVLLPALERRERGSKRD